MIMRLIDKLSPLLAIVLATLVIMATVEEEDCEFVRAEVVKVWDCPIPVYDVEQAKMMGVCEQVERRKEIFACERGNKFEKVKYKRERIAV